MNMENDGWIKQGGYDDTTPFWDKDTDKTVSGVLIDVQNNAGKEKTSTIYTVRKSDGEKIKFWGSAVIDSHLGGVEIGTEVRVDYLGKMPGKRYGNYEVYTRPAQAEESEKKSENEDDLPF